MLGAMSSRTLPLPPPVSWSPGLVGEYPGQQSQITLPGGVPMIFCWCPPPRPEDRLGTPKDEAGRRGTEVDPYPVPFTQGFWLAKHPVNQAQWRAVMGNNPSHRKGDDLPVEMVSWKDAHAFCLIAELSLPTEPMWEYACRAGTRSPFGIGTGPFVNSQIANIDGYEPYGEELKWLHRAATTVNGSFPPNDWGFHDMHGQLWEWCDHPGPDHRITVLRGGGFLSSGHYARSGARVERPDQYHSRTFGFRPTTGGYPKGSKK